MKKEINNFGINESTIFALMVEVNALKKMLKKGKINKNIYLKSLSKIIEDASWFEYCITTNKKGLSPF